MNFIVSLYNIFMFPTNLIIGIVSYFNMIKIYKDEIRSNEDTSHLTGYDLFQKANIKLSDNKERMDEYTEMVIERMGGLRARQF